MQKLESAGYKNIIYVAGSDRVDSFKKLLNDYNGKDYTFDSIQVVSAGERDPDAEGAEGMSASKMKQAASQGNYDEFEDGVAVNDPKLAKMMYTKVRQGMGINEQKPKLDVLNNIAARADGKPFPLSWNAGKGEISVGGKLFVDPINAKKFVSFFDRNTDKQDAMKKALQSASTTAKLFDVLGLKYKLDMER